jgi:RNA polymerase sigma-70 factor (TIGR02960 family)
MSFCPERRHTDMTALQLTDEAAFSELVERHRRELQVHCYRMLGSLEESEDLTQETFLRAWRSRETYAGRASLRAWLYRIATNACLDSLDRNPRTPSKSGEVAWLQPYPDELLEEIPASDETDPDALVVARETIELAFMVAIQHLPPRARAVLILRDVLSWRAKETAELLDTTVASVNSALQRARAGLKEHLPERRSEWVANDVSAADKELLRRYLAASDEGDVQALAATLHEDVRFTMPPTPGVWEGREKVVGGWVEGGFGDPERFGLMRCVPTTVNRQPAFGVYLQHPGDDRYRWLAVDVLTVAEGEIVAIFTFPDLPPAAFGLPAEL